MNPESHIVKLRHHFPVDPCPEAWDRGGHHYHRRSVDRVWEQQLPSRRTCRYCGAPEADVATRTPNRAAGRSVFDIPVRSSR